MTNFFAAYARSSDGSGLTGCGCCLQLFCCPNAEPFLHLAIFFVCFFFHLFRCFEALPDGLTKADGLDGFFRTAVHFDFVSQSGILCGLDNFDDFAIIGDVGHITSIVEALTWC